MKDIEKVFELKLYINLWSFVSKKYHDLINVFKKQNINKLFSHQKKYDIKIKLKLKKHLISVFYITCYKINYRFCNNIWMNIL